MALPAKELLIFFKTMTNTIALLVPANIWFCPYVRIYTNFFEEWGIPYKIIFWDKTNSEENEGFAFSFRTTSTFSKIKGYYKFSKFIKKIVREQNFSKVIVFGSQLGIFCNRFLKNRFNKRYIFDFRDLSIEQNRLLKRVFKSLLNNSYANVISSPGFKQCLPSGYKYYLSHNVTESQILKGIYPQEYILKQNPINILTIGGIRDFESNASIITSLANNPDIELDFVGEGPAKTSLKEFSKEKGVKNIKFRGFYKKEEEEAFVLSSTFLNIFYPDKITHATALSNRFYNSIIYRRPMIVTKGQIQGEYCEKYNLGVAVSEEGNLYQDLKNWLANTDMMTYEENCIRLLNDIMRDFTNFKGLIKSFCEL